MILEPTLSIVSPLAAEPGDLLMLDMRSHRAFGLVLAKDAKQSLIGLLYTDEADLVPRPPFAYNLDRMYGGSRECVSYGSDWVLELVPGRESVPGNKSEWATPGVVYVSSSGTTMFFATRSERSFLDGYTFDLGTSELTNGTDSGVPHLKWRIWRNAADRDHPAREPLLSFEGTSTALKV